MVGLVLEYRGDGLGHAVGGGVGVLRQVAVGLPGEIPVDGVFKGVEVLDGDDRGHGLAVARDDGGRSALGAGDDLCEVGTGIPRAQLVLAVVHTKSVPRIVYTGNLWVGRPTRRSRTVRDREVSQPGRHRSEVGQGPACPASSRTTPSRATSTSSSGMLSPERIAGSGQCQVFWWWAWVDRGRDSVSKTPGRPVGLGRTHCAGLPLRNASGPAGISPPTGKRRERRPWIPASSGKTASSRRAARCRSVIVNWLTAVAPSDRAARRRPPGGCQPSVGQPSGTAAGFGFGLGGQGNSSVISTQPTRIAAEVMKARS